MPVWRSLDSTVDTDKAGKPRRHISPDCPNYKVLTTAQKCRADGVPNTERLQKDTVRCDHPECWEKRLKEDALKPKRKNSGGGTAGKVSASKAATAPTTAVGGKAQSLADKAKAARQKPKAAAAPVAA